MKRLSCVLLLMLVVSSSGCGAMIVDAINKWDDSLHGHTSRRQQYVKSHPELPAKMKENILAGQIVIGMTKQEVFASWGQPVDRNRIVGAGGVIVESWRYGGAYAGCYLYFENEILTSWSDWGN